MSSDDSILFVVADSILNTVEVIRFGVKNDFTNVAKSIANVFKKLRKIGFSLKRPF